MNIQKLLDIELPIIQSPMAGVQGSALAVAVSNAEGLGSLPCAVLSLDDLRAGLLSITSSTSKPYNVNFFCHTPPAAQTDAEFVWRDSLSAYYKEYGINLDTISSGPGRHRGTRSCRAC